MTNLKQIPDYGKLIDSFCEDCRLRVLTDETTRRYRSSLVIIAEYMSRRSKDMINTDLQSLKELLQHVKYERKPKHKILALTASGISSRLGC